jgi:hypothetical protein
MRDLTKTPPSVARSFHPDAPKRPAGASAALGVRDNSRAICGSAAVMELSGDNDGGILSASLPHCLSGAIAVTMLLLTARTIGLL